MSFMPQHVLCFTDLSSANNVAIDEPGASAPMDSMETRHSHHHNQPKTLFVREENKTCSFVLKDPVSLIGEPDEKIFSSKTITNDDVIQSRSDATLVNFIDGAAPDTEKKHLVVTASITSSIISNAKDRESKPSAENVAQETFLFGGLELITNVKTIEVYVTRHIEGPLLPSKPKESYLTTCKGVPMRDLPPLTAPLNSMGKSHDVDCGVMMKNIEYFKFILVSPGGAKPLKRVRLKFVGSDTIPTGSVIVRTLKVKGRLADADATIPPTIITSLIQTTHGNMKDDITIHNRGKMVNMHELIDAAGMVSSIASKPQHAGRVHTQLFNHDDTHPLQLSHQQEKNQAELVNAIAGLGMFLKHSEERTMAKLDTMLANMEMRIMERMDNIAGRLDVMEQKIMVATRDDADEIIT